MSSDSGSRAERQDRNGLGPEDGRTAPAEGHRPTSGATQEIINRLKEELRELLFVHDPMCGYDDCESTADKIAPILVAILSTLTNLTPSEGVERIRAEALEEAAKVCDRQRCAAAAKAIRALALPSEPPSQDCPHCNGDGDIDDGDHPCMMCGGSGLAEPPSQADVEGRARELLAAEYEAAGYRNTAAAIRDNRPMHDERISLRAIVKALASKEDGRS